MIGTTWRLAESAEGCALRGREGLQRARADAQQALDAARTAAIEGEVQRGSLVVRMAPGKAYPARWRR